IVKVKGKKRVTSVAIGEQSGSGAVIEELECDAIAMSGGWSPVVHLWSHCGGKLVWDEERVFFRPDPAKPALGHDGAAMVYALGAANGALAAAPALEDAAARTLSACEAIGLKVPQSGAARADAV